MVAYAGDASIWTLPLIPLLSAPFADDACVALRAGGFAFGFDLQRPLPTFSPLALFELLALASDPLHYEVAPRGPLADTIRVTLAHARLTLPPAVVALFPSAAALPAPHREYTIDLADYVRVVQLVAGAVAPIVTRALALARDGALSAANLRAAVGGLGPAQLRGLALAAAEAVPPLLRQFALDADLGGFTGRATLAFATRGELRRAPADAWFARGRFAGVTVDDLDALDAAINTLDAPAAPRPGGFGGTLPGISRAALAGAAQAGTDVPGLVCAARITALAIELELLGTIRGDGTFVLVTRGTIAAPRLAIAGCVLALPWIATARGVLAGRAALGRSIGTLRLDGHAAAELVPGVLHVAIGNPRAPAALSLSSDGHFQIAAAGSLVLFGGLAALSGQLALTHERVAAIGALTAFHLHAADARFVADAAGFTLDAALRSPPGAPFPALELDCALAGRAAPADVELSGRASLRIPALAFALQGRGRWEHRAGASTLTVEGDAAWQGQVDVGAALTIRRELVALRLHCRVAPTLRGLLSHLPNAPRLDAVLPAVLGDLQLQLDADVRLAFTGGALSGAVRGTWSVALQPAGSTRFHTLLSARVDATFSAGLVVPLVDLADLPLLPVTSLSLPPAAVAAGRDVRLVRCVITPGIETLHFAFSDQVIPPYPSAPPGGSRALTDVKTFPSEFALSVSGAAATLPRLGIRLALGLVWRDQRLCLAVTAAGRPTAFVPLA